MLLRNLEKLAAANPQKLNWKVSIVDLMKLLGLDSGFARGRNWPSSSAARPRKWATRHK